MFCYQKSFVNPTLPVDEAQFYALVRATQWNENIDRFRETGDQSLKRKLPAFIFQATFDETTSKTGKVGRWRKQAATRLTGLVVMDVDHIDTHPLPLPRGGVMEKPTPQDYYNVWRETHPELFANQAPLTSGGDGDGSILLVYITPSGKGLKIVFKADVTKGNLIDNQHEMAKVLGVEVDESCKDASRMSFICKESDILFIDKELFTYENKEFAERYDALYRDGRSQGKSEDFRVKSEELRAKNEELEVKSEELNYHGIEYKRICEAWQAAQGGAMELNTRESAKRGRPHKAERLPLETAIEQCCNWLSTSGISATTSRKWSTGCLDCADLYRTSSGSEGTRKSRTLLIRLVSESCIRTSRKGCKGYLKVWVFMEATPQQLQALWEAMKSLTSSSLKGWSLSFAPLMPKPVGE